MTAPHRLKDLADVQELIRIQSLPRTLADHLQPYVRDKDREVPHVRGQPATRPTLQPGEITGEEPIDSVPIADTGSLEQGKGRVSRRGGRISRALGFHFVGGADRTTPALHSSVNYEQTF